MDQDCLLDGPPVITADAPPMPSLASRAPLRPRNRSPSPAARRATEAGQDAARLELGRWLQAQGYRYTTVTPETHRRVNARPTLQQAQDLRDVFGWNRPFAESLLPREIVELLRRAGALSHHGERLRSRLRYSTLDGLLFAHSGYPTLEADAVFFGPDTYRFAALIRRALATPGVRPPQRIVDIGCGSGAGGIVAASLLPDDVRLTLSDINPRALRHAATNAALAGLATAEFVESDVLRSVEGPVDLVLANPPYMTDTAGRLYRDGGDRYGCELSLRIVAESLSRLAPGGRLVLYTGAPQVGGEDLFWRAAQPLLRQARARFEYVELDPDVFGEELDNPEYHAVERIAAVGLIAQLPEENP